MSGRLYFNKAKGFLKVKGPLIQICGKATVCPIDHESQVKEQPRDMNSEWQHVRPFEDIPGPKALPLIGNTFRFMPYIGEYGDIQMLTLMQTMRDTFGVIVKLDEVLNRRRTVFLFDPDLCEKMYRVQGVWPSRVAMESFHHYRQKRSSVFEGLVGLTTSQGKEWHDFRTKVNQHMMQPRAIKPHVSQIDEVASDFVEKMRTLRDPQTLELPESFNNELYKWGLESICSIALDQRLGCLESDLAEDSEQQKMIDCVHEMFLLMYELEFRPSLWKIYNTPNLKRMFYILDTINEITMKYINEAKEKLKDKSVSDSEERSVLQKLLSIDPQTANVMAMDMLTAGVDTTGSAIGSVLYHLANNPRVQEKLREEVMSVLPSKTSRITYETLNNVPYVKACVKEALRIFPITIGSMRTMQTDVIIGGYKIPKGTDVIPCHALLAKDPAQFPQPEDFIPERWMRDNKEKYPLAKDAHPFSYMPFGFGPRTCIGRRFAELEMESLTLKVIRNFKLEWHHEPLQFKSLFINTITTPLRFKIIDV